VESRPGKAIKGAFSEKKVIRCFAYFGKTGSKVIIFFFVLKEFLENPFKYKRPWAAVVSSLCWYHGVSSE
jgi:hypothetical protein